METIRIRLFELQDVEYKEFQCRLMPTVSPERVIGIRTPHLRKLAKEIKGSLEAEEFLEELPHFYYEENNLHAFLVEQIRDYDSCIEALERFLPYVDNWATCDSMSPKVLKRQPLKLADKISEWLSSGDTYSIRFGMKMLMTHYLDEWFESEYPKMVASVHSEEYYVKMMIAWYFATALAKQYEAVIPYIEERMLEPWIHNKTIQKAIESYRITDEQKKYLKKLRDSKHRKGEQDDFLCGR